MRRNHQVIGGCAQVLILIAATSCGDDKILSPPEPQTGWAAITIETQGATIDRDGYVLAGFGDPAFPVGTSGTVVYVDVEPGQYQASLTGIAANCASDGGDTVALSVVAGDTTKHTFVITCRYAVRDEIVFDRDPFGGIDDIFVVGMDGSGLLNLSDSPDSSDGEPSISPDGTKIAFVSNRAGNNGDIYVMNADGSDLRQITDDPSNEASPAWSPDGEYFAFASSAEGDWNIYVMRADGTERRQLTFDPGAENFPTWSPDGSQIAYDGTAESGGFYGEIFIIDLAGGQPRNLTNSGAFDDNPAWSPSGEWIAFNSNRAGSDDIWLMHPDGSAATQVTSSPNNEGYPSWSPDGTKIVFSAIGIDTNGWDLFLVDLQTSQVSPLVAERSTDLFPQWSPLP